MHTLAKTASQWVEYNLQLYFIDIFCFFQQNNVYTKCKKHISKHNFTTHDRFITSLFCCTSFIKAKVFTMLQFSHFFQNHLWYDFTAHFWHIWRFVNQIKMPHGAFTERFIYYFYLLYQHISICKYEHPYKSISLPVHKVCSRDVLLQDN